ncbi:MAG: glycerophosphodiester phosphodiesterase [Treponema sp.]|jgi:glycerophosphoryl diester phosphodiesterase|nr:glycerophosphodiester phosphodiesterase [Treponema sp.]
MTKNFAHRGFSARYPENTMPAFQKAVETGCDGIELDIHLTREGKIVIIHDETVDRTTNGRGFVKDMDYAELRKFDAGNGEPVPLMEEYFDLAEKHPLITNIELKNSVFWYEGMEEKVIEMIRKRGIGDRIIFPSFNHFSILKCKKLAPEIRCGFLVWSWIIDAGAYTQKHGIEGFHPEYCSLTDEAVREIHSRGIAINAYTVNDRKDMERLISLGVDAIITNDPELLNRVLKE